MVGGTSGSPGYYLELALLVHWISKMHHRYLMLTVSRPPRRSLYHPATRLDKGEEVLQEYTPCPNDVNTNQRVSCVVFVQ